ncbi:MAG: ABC transporter substrate-binding protein [Oscillospiraceae bacterium]|nr:ABC transporter substrate-binding protein [Oscillospiraceae bacterium]
MKKILAMILALVMVLSLTACGGSSAPAETQAAAAGEAAASGEKFVVGVCQLVPHAALDMATQGFVDKLTEILGEENVEVIVQVAAGDSATCAPIVNDFVAQEVDLIMANATPALQAAAAATADIPILGTSVTEYGVAMGIEGFTGTVGGNVSGTSDLAPLDKQADMVTEWCPDAKTVGLVYCSAEPNSQYQVDEVQRLLEEKGLTVTQYPFADSNDMAAVAQTACDASDVIYVPTDNQVASSTGIIDGVCQPAGVPVIAGEESTCKGCGIATLSISYYDLGVKTGEMAAQILKGEADISTMPIAYADKQTAKYNPVICEALGITPLEGYEALELN